MKKGFNYNTLTYADLVAAGLKDNVCLNPASHEEFILDIAETLYHDLHIACRDVQGYGTLTKRNVRKLIKTLSEEIFLTYCDIYDEEFPEPFETSDAQKTL